MIIDLILIIGAAALASYVFLDAIPWMFRRILSLRETNPSDNEGYDD
jgi:hypothetical protein